MRKAGLAAITAIITMFASASVLAASTEDIAALRAEIKNMRQAYESRIAELEARLAAIEDAPAGAPAGSGAPVAEVAEQSAPPATAKREVKNNSFNPSIGIILNGQFNSFSSAEGEVAGFAVGEEGERPGEGFAVDHTELNFSANVDDKLYGNVTAAIAEHEGATEVELEEAYIQTLPDAGLPNGLGVKLGRAFWTIGYLNEHHSHTDDFVDRPLPYRVFLDGAFNDDGAEISWLLPTEFYAEIGGGVFRGDDFPLGGADGNGFGAWSAFARAGGDIGFNQSWRLGGYVLKGRSEDARESNEDELAFIGDTDLYAVDLRYTWAPTGNAREQEVIFQGEYFRRNEDGTYEDMAAGIGPVAFDDSSNGWYVQSVYKFAQQWRAGVRYSMLNAPGVPDGLTGSDILNANGYDPRAYSLMLDWTNSEFSRVRLQYNREELARSQDDNQFMLQYIMSIGAHGAHKY